MLFCHTLFLSTIIHIHQTPRFFAPAFLSFFFLSFFPFFPFLFFFSFLFSFFTFSSFLTPFLLSSHCTGVKWQSMVHPSALNPSALHCLWAWSLSFCLFLFLLCSGECLGLSHPLSSPFPFPPLCVVSCRLIHPHVCVCHHSHVVSCLPSVCVRQGTSTVCVCWLAHTNTLRCCAPSSLVFSFCVSLPPPSPSTSALLSLSETSGGNGKHHQHTCVFQTTCGKRGGGANTPWLEATAPQSPPLSLCTLCGCHAVCCFTHSTTQKAFVLQKKRKKKRDYDTWCSQVVSNPCPNQARTGFTSLIRREVVLSSWYGRNSFFRLRCVDFWQ